MTPNPPDEKQEARLAAVEAALKEAPDLPTALKGEG